MPFVSRFDFSPIYSNSAWVCFYFSLLIYLPLFFTSILYLLPNITLFSQSNSTSAWSSFDSVDGTKFLKTLVTPVLVLLILHTSWAGPVLTAWFGHITFSALQYKFLPLLMLFFVTYLSAFSLNVHFSSTQVYDYSSTVFNFFTWILLILFSNNLFTFIFFLELLSTLVMLLLITSTFSSNHMYNTLSYSKSSYFENSAPTAFLQTILMFFWTTLIASLALFLFTIIFYQNFLTFDWNIISSVFSFLVTTSTLGDNIVFAFSWMLLLSCVFIKCGIVPFYVWKPAFFRGMTTLSLFFYIYIYYFTLFFYFIYVIFFNLNELFIFNIFVTILFLFLGTIILATILFESFYVKAFLALSSILNSLLIFYALSSLHAVDIAFFI